MGTNNIQVSGLELNQTVITVTSTGEQLAILENVSPEAVANTLGIQFQPNFILREEGFLEEGDL
ncbi:hypothetical protein ACL6C3_15120 [Capilliphycus salinus ALCB114379]|uniref:hypothetical protein n=1 Tax=Capilliphycus salinus TaxID=2768948 RepID=UPI0039A5D345